MTHYFVEHLHHEGAARGREAYPDFPDGLLVAHHETHLKFLERKNLPDAIRLDREGLVSALESEMVRRQVMPKEGLAFYTPSARAEALQIQRVQTRR